MKKQDTKKKKAISQKKQKPKVKVPKILKCGSDVKQPSIISDWALKNQQELNENSTQTEISVRKQLKQAKVHYIQNLPVRAMNGHLYFIDFALRGRIALELDGGYHYSSKKQIEYDAERDAELGRLGWRVIRLRNCEATKKVFWKNLSYEIGLVQKKETDATEQYASSIDDTVKDDRFSDTSRDSWNIPVYSRPELAQRWRDILLLVKANAPVGYNEAGPIAVAFLTNKHPEQLSPREMWLWLVNKEKKYTLYTKRCIGNKNAENKPSFATGRVIKTGDGEYWIGFFNSWIRDDKLGPIIANTYKSVIKRKNEAKLMRN